MGQRLIITERERNRILNLHGASNKLIYVVEGPNDVLGNQGTPVSGATNTGPGIENTVNQPGLPASQPPTKITQLQNKLNQKFKSGLTADGKWGSKTANAVLTALKGLSPQQQQPPAQQPANIEEPTQKLPTLPAGAVQRPGQPTQLAGQTQPKK